MFFAELHGTISLPGCGHPYGKVEKKKGFGHLFIEKTETSTCLKRQCTESQI